MKLDFTNKACPIPVIESKKALMNMNENEEFIIIVDNQAAKENITRLLKELKQDFKLNDFTFTGTKSNIVLSKNEKEENTKECLFLKAQKVGDGELGYMLTVGFLTALKEKKIDRIILVNDAIFMACDENHQAFNILKELESLGVEVLSCANCLNYFSLSPKIGRSANAMEIVECLFSYKVLSLWG